MCTLCLSDMGELRDEWLRLPMPPLAPAHPIKRLVVIPRSKRPSAPWPPVDRLPQCLPEPA